MLRAVIFDMDGLMIDTERLHHESFKAVLERYGITPVPNAQGVIHISGISAEANWEHFQKQYGFSADTQELTKAKNDIHLSLLKNKVRAMPGLLKLLKNLKNDGYKTGIASSSIREHIDIVTREYGASQAIWDEALALGKPVIAHVIPDQTAYNTSITKGANGVQVSGVAVVDPVSWWTQ